jgi:hypothetical protein
MTILTTMRFIITASRQQIVDLYLSRPRTLVQMDLGMWFVKATRIKDETLKSDGLISHALMHIQNAGYDYEPQLLMKLQAFNEFNKV